MQPSPLLQALNRTFHVMNVAGFDIRVHWTVFVYLLIMLGHYSGAAAASSASPLLLALSGFFVLFAIILVHELGHALAARRLGLGIRHIVLSPIGGQANLESNPRSPREEFIVTFWGPAVHPLLLLVAAAPYLLISDGQINLGYYGNEWVRQFFWINVFLLLFNLIPAFPLDGGRFLRAFLASRMPAARATILAAYVGQVASIIFIIVALTYGGDFRFLLFIIGVMNLFVCEQAKRMARYVDPYEQYGGEYEVERYDTGYRDESASPEPYRPSYQSESYLETDDDDGKRQPKARRPGPLKRYLAERAERREQERLELEREVRAKVDELLEKVSSVGMDGLTEREREYLQQASSLYKGSSYKK